MYSDLMVDIRLVSTVRDCVEDGGGEYVGNEDGDLKAR